MLNSYIVIDADNKIRHKIEETQFFDDMLCLGVYTDYDSALNGILEKKPQLIFFCFDNAIPITLLMELHQYLDDLPYVIAVNQDEKNAYKALKLGVSDYLLLPMEPSELRKALMKYSKLYGNKQENRLCIKSNGDYHFVSLDDIVYLKADNNTTDFYLQNGKVISGFKTMKFFETSLPFYFFRIHNSYIVNIQYVSRINIGKNDCYLHGNEYKLPFSRSYKSNVDTMIKKIS